MEVGLRDPQAYRYDKGIRLLFSWIPILTIQTVD